MARTKFLIVPILGVLCFGLSGCSPSPLYVDRGQVGTFGQIPRDSRGEPIWSSIPPAPPTVQTPQP